MRSIMIGYNISEEDKNSVNIELQRRGRKMRREPIKIARKLDEKDAKWATVKESTHERVFERFQKVFAIINARWQSRTVNWFSPVPCVGYLHNHPNQFSILEISLDHGRSRQGEIGFRFPIKGPLPDSSRKKNRLSISCEPRGRGVSLKGIKCQTASKPRKILHGRKIIALISLDGTKVTLKNQLWRSWELFVPVDKGAFINNNDTIYCVQLQDFCSLWIFSLES